MKSKKKAKPTKSSKKAVTKKAVAKKEQPFADLAKLDKNSLGVLQGLLKLNNKDKTVKKLVGVLKAKKISKPEYESVEKFLGEVLDSIEEDITMISLIKKDVKGLKSHLKTSRV